MVRMNFAGGGGNRLWGRAGAGSSASWMPGERAGLLGSRGGRDGRSDSADRAGRAGMDRFGSNGAWTIFAAVAALASSASRACAASRSLLDGGRGGSEACSSGGGSFRPSTDPRLVVDESVLLPRDCDDTVDLMDSPEARRTTSDWVEGLLGGRPGDVCVCSESRLGSGGARPRAVGEGVAFSGPVLVLWGRVGGSFLVGRTGTSGVAGCEPSPGWGEAVACAWVGAREGGRLGGGGGGGLLEGAVKFLCLLRAAILSDSELNVGSSVSAIVAPKP